jgi:light-harvesting protein B-800-850 alpha chain
MNQGRIWCVVNPTVGLPLFLGSVTLLSLTVHASVMSNTTWFAEFHQGSAAAETAMASPPVAVAAAPAVDAVVATPTAMASAPVDGKVMAAAASSAAPPAG